MESNDDIGCVGAVVLLHQVQVEINGVPEEGPATLTGSLCRILGGPIMISDVQVPGFSYIKFR